jgi:glutathione S-transferase
MLTKNTLSINMGTGALLRLKRASLWTYIVALLPSYLGLKWLTATPPVTHFSEGSLMPLLVNRLIFSLVPAQAPFFLRPLLRPLFSALDARIIAGQLNACLKYVHPSLPLSRMLVFSPQLQVEDALEKSPTGWFAGGPNPTMADYMMSFGLEAADFRAPDLLGPKTKAWVERVHER